MRESASTDLREPQGSNPLGPPGPELPAVLVSMATSDAENLPRDAEFLFSANRLNVALSRAECLGVVMASAKLLETPCRTIEQMRLINNFCRLSVG